MRYLSSAFAANLCFALLAAQAATAQQYQVTDLGTLGGQSFGLDISQSGAVTGDSYIACAECSLSHAFLYRKGIMQDLGTLPGGSFSSGYGISEGERRKELLVTGSSNFESCSYDSCSPMHAVLFKNGNVIDLGTLPGGTESQGYAVNREGDVTGWADVPVASGFNQHPFLYIDGHMQDLGTLPGGVAGFGMDLTEGESKDRDTHGANDRDRDEGVQVTGFSSTAAGTEHAFLYRNGKMQDLGTLPGGHSSAGFAINRAGQVTGYSDTTGGNPHAFLYSHGVMRDLGTLPGRTESFGDGINRSGQIVGNSEIVFDSHAFLYSDGHMQDLNDLIPSGSRWVLEFADAINDRGQITGTGNHNGEEHAYRLTPISHPQMDEDDNDSD
jgi:probable HAF family extracellular repeat protein